MGYPTDKEYDGVLVTFNGIVSDNPANPTPPNRTYYCPRINANSCQKLTEIEEITWTFVVTNPRLWYAVLTHRFRNTSFEPFLGNNGYWFDSTPYAFDNTHLPEELPYHSGNASVSPVPGTSDPDSLQSIITNMLIPPAKGTFGEQFAPVGNGRVLRVARVRDHTCCYIKPTSTIT